MKLTVSTPFKSLTYENISLINLPGIDGQVGILNKHAPMIISLKAGTVFMADKGHLTIQGGIAYVKPDETILITDSDVTHVI